MISYDVVHNMHAKYDMVKLEYNPMAFQNHKNIKTWKLENVCEKTKIFKEEVWIARSS